MTRVADSYKLVIVNKWGQVLERDGTFYRSDSRRQPFKQEFVDLESARRFAETVVREHPHAECDVFCGEQMVLQHFDPEWRRADEEQTRRMFVEQRRRDRRVISAIIAGVVLLIVGVLILCFR